MVRLLLAFFVALPLVLADSLLSRGFRMAESPFDSVVFRQPEPELGRSHSVVFPRHADSAEREVANYVQLLKDLQEDPASNAANDYSAWRSLMGLDADAANDEDCQASEFKGDEYRFVPMYKGSAAPGGAALAVADQEACFRSAELSVAVSGSTATVTLAVSAAASLTCRDLFLLATPSRFHPELVVFRGRHTVELRSLTDAELADLRANGVRLFRFCVGAARLLQSVYKTAKLFLGGLGLGERPILGSHVPEYMAQANRQFIENAMGWQMEERPVQVVDLPEEAVESGDFLAILRLDGVDPIIMWGSGSHVGHTAIALRVAVNGSATPQLLVCESQDGWYWPTHGIQCNPWAVWVREAAAADFHVAVLKLRPEVRARFDAAKAYAWVQTKLGLPYGYHNFLFGWLDTPRDNFPVYLAPETALTAFAVMDRVVPKATARFLGEALNKRLGTAGLRVAELYAAAAARQPPVRVEDLLATVEDDAWVYSDGPSMVCSVFVTGTLRAAGVFGDLALQATEFTPRDVYTLDLWERDAARPAACEAADPNQPWCQILGRYRLTLPGYSTITPYAHMAERCPSKAPTYLRPDSC